MQTPLPRAVTLVPQWQSILLRYAETRFSVRLQCILLGWTDYSYFCNFLYCKNFKIAKIYNCYMRNFVICIEFTNIITIKIAHIFIHFQLQQKDLQIFVILANFIKI